MDRSSEFEHRDLALRAIRGDTDAFEQLYQRYTNSILYHTRRYISDLGEAEDAAQEAVIEMYRSIGTLRDPDAFLPWMYRLIKFVCLKHVRARKAGMGRYGISDIDEFSETLADETKDSDPSEMMVEDERVKTIRGIIGRLPEKQREAVVLFYYEQLSYREIAKALDANPSTVSTNIMKARKKIAKELQEALRADSLIAVAVTADMGAKLSGINISAFHAACKAGVAGAAKATAAGMGYGSATQATQAGQYAGKSIGSAVQSPGATAFSVVLYAAAAITVAAAVTTVSSGSVGSAPAGTANAEPPAAVQSYTPAADIEFLGGGCACGHLNPQTAMLTLTDDTDMLEGWEILSEGAPVSEGTGKDVSLGGLPDGDYTVKYTLVSSEDGRKAFSSRGFVVVSGPTKTVYL